jgi:imidazolonepropionase-like amidohydrolase
MDKGQASRMILIKNARIVDGTSPEPSSPVHVVIEGDLVREVGNTVTSQAKTVIDMTGHTLMPGLIDCHVHVVATSANLGENAMLPCSLVATRALGIMNAMLMRGFTTVRDVGGADYGLKIAADEGLVPMPRLILSGKALSQTGGHCDFRGRFDDTPPPRTRFRLGALGRLCDGIDEARRASREEIKGGADFIKIMANGGVASPTDPIHFLGFSRDEIKAIVEEATNAGTYVSAHLYTDEAIRRAVECGVHSLEHCNLIGSDTAQHAAAQGCIAVPTLVTYDKLASDGAALGFPASSVAKIDTVRLAGLESLSIMKSAGLTMAYGSDLLGAMHQYQSDEFVIRGQVLPAHEVIATATHIAAKLCRQEGKIGVIAPGAQADLIAVKGNPLKDLALLTGQGRHMPFIMRGGQIIKSLAMN